MARIFLSYDHEDMGLAKPIADALEKSGHTVWYDRHIQGGAQYSHKIEQALDAADTVVVLWSKHSLDSAWVRDEAAEGRDRGKLVPLKVGGVTVPIGFRQFQTIDLGAWKGRGKVPNFDRLLDAVGSQREESAVSSPGIATTLSPPAARPKARPKIIFAAVAALLIAAFSFGAWKWFGGEELPVVEVAAAETSPRSIAAANELYVKLGSLAQVGQGKWQLVDAATASGKPTFLFRTADLGSPQVPRANLVLTGGKDGSLLWSREFAVPSGGQADLRQQVSVTAGRVLGCALETREAGGLRADLYKLFLDACASAAELSYDDADKVAGQFRLITQQAPKFRPAWSRLLAAAGTADDVMSNAGERRDTLERLKEDVARAKRAFPELPELALVIPRLDKSLSFGSKLELTEAALRTSPENVALLDQKSSQLIAVGRVSDAALSARRVAALDPLSPNATTQYILSLAQAGQISEARDELAKAEKTWAGTGALHDAQWGFNMRYGDPHVALAMKEGQSDAMKTFLGLRLDPDPAAIEREVASLRPYLEKHDSGAFGFVTQELAEFKRTDEVFNWIAQTPASVVADYSYLLFRPAFAAVRADPRFMGVAARIGLVRYWSSSGDWPDFCSDAALPYNCKTEAAKYAR